MGEPLGDVVLGPVIGAIHLLPVVRGEGLRGVVRCAGRVHPALDAVVPVDDLRFRTFSAFLLSEIEQFRRPKREKAFESF